MMPNLFSVLLLCLGVGSLAASGFAYAMVRRKVRVFEAAELGFRYVRVVRKDNTEYRGWIRSFRIQAFRDMPGQDTVMEILSANGKVLVRFFDIELLEESTKKDFWKIRNFP